MFRPISALPIDPSATKKSKRVASWPAYSIVLLSFLAATFPPGLLTGMNLYLLFLAGIVWTTSRQQLDRNLLRVAWPFIGIALIGLLMGIGSERYIYLKDAWYVLNPLIVVCVGYVFFRAMPDPAKGLRAFVIGGVILSVIQIIKIAANTELLSFTAADIRKIIGTGYYAPALAAAILFSVRSNWRESLGLPRWIAVFFLLICLVAVGVSFSRTILLLAAIGGIASLGFFSQKEIRRIGVMLMVATVLIGGLRLVVDIESREANTSVIGKIARATEELKIQEYTSFQQINDNWRGYETARAFNSYANGSIPELALGQGFGARVDLGLFMPLGSGDGGERVRVRFVPILHNGYAYLLVKGGPIAIALFLVSMRALYRTGRTQARGAANSLQTQIARLLQGVAVCLVVATWVIGGVFNKLDMFPYLLLAGYLLAALNHQREGQS